MFGKKKGLFQSDIVPRCVYCAKGAPLEEGKILCSKKGVVRAGASCAAFCYDPLKRIPPRQARLDTEKLRQEDFSLD